MLGKRTRRASWRAWGPEADHSHNLSTDSPCSLSVEGPGCGKADCHNRLMVPSQWELRELPGVGKGAFALEDLSVGQWVGEYTGKMTVSRQGTPDLPNRQYTLSGFVCGRTVTVDADRVPAAKRVLTHHINHACAPKANW